MKHQGLKKKLIALILASTFVSACGKSADNPVRVDIPNTVVSENTLESMLAEPSIEYEIPETIPLISVNLVGYELSDMKQAVIVSDNLPSTFQVMDSKTNEPVFEGTIKKNSVDYDDQKETGIADFSDLKEEGSYYIYAEFVGTSKTFPIKSNVYKDELERNLLALNGLRFSNSKWTIENLISLENEQAIKIDVAGGWLFGENGERDVVKGAIAAMDLMVAFDYNKDSFKDNVGIEESGNRIPDILDEITYEMNWLMKMQNSSTGGVYSSVYLPENASSEDNLLVAGETTKATAYFCAAMAKYSVLCKNYDRETSTMCFNAASKAYKCLEANRDIVSEEQMYRAAVEMYRATGYAVYNNIILKYLETNADKDYEGRTGLDAAITYLATPRATNAEYCSLLMAYFMSRTEDKSDSALKSRYMVERDVTEISELLRNASELVLVDYIISSVEYLKLEKNYFHYICGRNEMSEKLNGFGYSPDLYAQYIILLGRLGKESK